MKTLICLMAFCLATVTAKAGNYTGRYYGTYTITVEKITVDGKTYPGGQFTGVKVDARVRDSGRLVALSSGYMKFNGVRTGVYIDEAGYGKVDSTGRITLYNGGLKPVSYSDSFGKYTLERKSARIRYGRMEIEYLYRTQKLGLARYRVVAYKY